MCRVQHLSNAGASGWTDAGDESKCNQIIASYYIKTSAAVPSTPFTKASAS